MSGDEKSVLVAEINDENHGITTPRLWTKPLRELNKRTSNGFAVIAFAIVVLKIELYPWQC